MLFYNVKSIKKKKKVCYNNFLITDNCINNEKKTQTKQIYLIKMIKNIKIESIQNKTTVDKICVRAN